MRGALYATLCVVAIFASGAATVAVAQTSETPAPAAGAVRPAPIEGVVNVNAASAQELSLLPGVGPARARSIIEYREKNGPFKDVRDLLAVSGIGERALGRMRAFVVLEGETTARRVRPSRTPASP
jgi:competence protein ComEA